MLLSARSCARRPEVGSDAMNTMRRGRYMLDGQDAIHPGRMRFTCLAQGNYVSWTIALDPSCFLRVSCKFTSSKYRLYNAVCILRPQNVNGTGGDAVPRATFDTWGSVLSRSVVFSMAGACMLRQTLSDGALSPGE
jgi:hypothetical protein